MNLVRRGLRGQVSDTIYPPSHEWGEGWHSDGHSIRRRPDACHVFGQKRKKREMNSRTTECGLEEVSLLQDDDEILKCPQRNPRNKPFQKVFRTLVLVFGATGAFYLGRLSQVKFPSAPIQKQPLSSPFINSPINRPLRNPRLVALGDPCPHENWAEAKAQGCIYDLMLSSWLHPACATVELYAKYREWMAWRNVTFWREPEMINEVSYAEAESGEHGFLWAQGIQHHLHCSYVWDRQRFAEERTPKVLDAYSRNSSHVDHCAFFNAVPFGWEIVAPNVTRIYQPYDNDCLMDAM
jgi:hypothetical protein